MRLFVDGQKATGGARVVTGDSAAEVELSGNGSGSRYAGTLQGKRTAAGKVLPLSGSWTATLAGSAQINFKLGSQGASAQTFTLSLSQTEYAALRCSWLRGTATRRPAGGSPIPLAAGTALKLGDIIETGAGSSAIVVLGDRSVVMMQERTRLEIPDVPENRQGTQKVKASSGKIWFAVRKVQDGRKFEVETDEVVAAVRGTEFVLEFEDDGQMSLTTAEGEVALTDLARERPFIPVRAGTRWARRRGARAPWEPPAACDLRPHVLHWRHLLAEADRHWPFRRAGKQGFWQDRFRDEDGRGGQRPGTQQRPGGQSRPGAGPRRGPGAVPPAERRGATTNNTSGTRKSLPAGRPAPAKQRRTPRR